MPRSARLNSISQIIKLSKRVSVEDLSTKFNVTPETIRRDLTDLEAKGIVTRTYGGAVINEARVIENSSFLLRMQHHQEEKRIIAGLAHDLIPKHCVIAADASSTVFEAVRTLQNEKDITLLTNSTHIVSAFTNSPIQIVSTGGTVNNSTFSMQGSITRNVLKTFYVDVALLSCKALSVSGGVFDSNEEEAEIKKLMIERAQKVILLADHSKFDHVAFVRLMHFADIHTLVTDREPSQDFRDVLTKNGIFLSYRQ